MTNRNRVLESLSPSSRATIAQWLNPIDTAAGEILIEQGAPVTDLHFPLSGTLSNLVLFADGRAAETACIGCEGMSGLAAFLAEAPCAWQVSVQIPGQIVRVPAAAIRALCETDVAFRTLLILLSHDYQAQAAQTAACNILHSATQRLSRWLLLALDRTGEDAVPVTQSDLGVALGVRRSTVSDVLHDIRASGAIRLGRRRIHIVERARLETIVCECYRRDRERSRDLGLVGPQD